MRSILQVLYTIIQSIGHHILNAVYPVFCVLCGVWVQEGKPSCLLCSSDLVLPPPLMLPLKGTLFMRVWAVGNYAGGLKKKIMGKMYGNRAATYQLGQLAMSIPEFGPFQDESFCNNAIFIPIPLHWARQWRRGFNQADVLAEIYSDKTGIVMKSLLTRSRHTAYQAQLSRKGRLVNLDKAFALSDNYAKQDFKGKHLILVDDVCTTGQTLVHAAKPLQALGPASISAIVIARGF